MKSTSFFNKRSLIYRLLSVIVLAALILSIAAPKSASAALWSEEFAGGLPSGWEKGDSVSQGEGGYVPQWSINFNHRISEIHAHTANFSMLNVNGKIWIDSNWVLVPPQGATLSYDSTMRGTSVGQSEGRLFYTTDGTIWSQLDTIWSFDRLSSPGPDGSTFDWHPQSITLPDDAKGKSVRFRWEYWNSGSYIYWIEWNIDNVLLTGLGDSETLSVTGQSALPVALTGTSFATNQALSISGGVPPYTVSIVPVNPVPGLTLAIDEDYLFTISGVPTVPGNYGFSIKVQDSYTVPHIKTLSYELLVQESTITTTSAVPPSDMYPQGAVVATVTGTSNGAGVTSGEVNFSDGGNAIRGCQGVSLSNGTAACQGAWLAPGANHQVSANFLGDSIYLSSAATAVPFSPVCESNVMVENDKDTQLDANGSPIIVDENLLGEVGSLRSALSNPRLCLGGTITFAGSYTIHPYGFAINRDVNIDGAGHQIILSGDLPNDGLGDADSNGPNDITLFIIFEGATVSLNHLTLINAEAMGWGSIYGGAINNFGSLTVTNSTFSNNHSKYYGGAIGSSANGSLSISNSTFTSNTFSGNSSNVHGGGAIFIAGTATLVNNTFVGNGGQSSGASVTASNSSSVTLINNLMVRSGTIPNCNIALGAVTSANNLADDDSCGTGFTIFPTLSSQVGQLSDNGGPTQTIPLLAGSAAIDAGDDSQCPATDQRGVSRPQGARCDIGAYEVEAQVQPPSDYIISGSVYDDLNANGSRDANESGIENAPVILALNKGQVTFNSVPLSTIADGSFQYTLTVPAGEIPAGFSISVFVEPATGIKITQTPAQYIPLTGILTGMDIGINKIVVTVTPNRFPDGVQGVSYNQTMTLAGGVVPYIFTPTSSWSMPAGLSYAFDPLAGTITFSGTPTEAGTFHTHVDVQEGTGMLGQVWEDFIIHPPMQFSPATLPDGSLGAAYNQTILLSGGIAPYSFVRYGGEQWLPTGMTLNTSSGNIVITGMPTVAGQVMLDVYFKDQTGTEIEIQPTFWIKTAPSLTLTSSLNPSLQGQEVTFSLGSTATVAGWPAPWGQVTFKADGTAIPDCVDLWMGSNPVTEEPAPNPVTCSTSSLAVGSHTITADLTTVYGPYNNATATLQGGQTVNASVPQYQSAGFGAPLDLGSVLNTAKAGQMIPLKWRLLDASGAPVISLTSSDVTLTVSSYSCPSGVSVDAIETYTTGTTVLQNLGDGYYQMNWKTEKTWVNSCKQLTLKIGAWTGDGLTALFQFKK